MSTSDTDPTLASTAADAAATGASDLLPKAASSSNARSASEPTSISTDTSKSSTQTASRGSGGTHTASNGNADPDSNISNEKFVNSNVGINNHRKADNNVKKIDDNEQQFVINNPTSGDDLGPLVRIPVPAAKQSVAAQKLKETRESAYAVNLISGTELYLNKKSLLLAHVDFMQNLVDGKQREIDSFESRELSSSRGFFAGAEAGLARAEAELVRAKAGVREAEAEVAEREEQLAIKLQEKAEMQKKVDLARSAARDAGASVDSEADESNHNAEGVGAECEKEGEDNDAGAGENQKGGEKLAGKRSRDENDITIEDKDTTSSEPPKKAAKIDDSMAKPGENAKVGLLGFDDVSSGASDANALETYADNTKNDANADGAHKGISLGEEPVVINPSVLRSKVRECINEHRETEGLIPVPLDEMVFCIMTETGTSLFDEEHIHETLLASSDITIGVRFFPSLTFEKLMRPFHVLARSLMTAGGHGGGSGTESNDDGNAENNRDVSADTTTQNTVGDRSDQTWWKIQDLDGNDLGYSEARATAIVATGLLRPTWMLQAPEFDYFREVSFSFFRHHLCLDGCPVQSDDLDADFHRVCSGSESRWSFPSEKAMKIAAFQLDEANAAAISKIFPMFVANMFAGFVFDGERSLEFGFSDSGARKGLEESVICFLRILLRLTTANPELTSTCWNWTDAGSSLTYFDFKSPLALTCSEGGGASTLVHTQMCEILLKVFKISHALSTRSSAPDSVKETHWNLKQSVAHSFCGSPVEDEQGWQAFVSDQVRYHSIKTGEYHSYYYSPLRRCESNLAFARGIEKLEAPNAILSKIAEVTQQEKKLEEKKKNLQEEKKRVEAEIAAAASGSSESTALDVDDPDHPMFWTALRSRN